MKEYPQPMALEDFITSQHLASCRLEVVNEGAGNVYIVRSQSGAEHFFAVVDCTTQAGEHWYATGPELMDRYGQRRRVVLGYVMIGI